MHNIFGHQVKTTHTHVGDSSSPAIYVGIIVITITLVLILSFLLSRNTKKSVTEEIDPSKE